MPWDVSKANSCDEHFNFCTLHVGDNGQRWVPLDAEQETNVAKSTWLWANECGKCNATCGFGAKMLACTGMIATGTATATAAVTSVIANCAVAPEICAAMLGE